MISPVASPRCQPLHCLRDGCSSLGGSVYVATSFVGRVRQKWDREFWFVKEGLYSGRLASKQNSQHKIVIWLSLEMYGV